jgi:hypothetical protein
VVICVTFAHRATTGPAKIQTTLRMMTSCLKFAALATALTTTASAGLISLEPAAPVAVGGGGFDKVRRPITNPTLFDLALPTTNVHPIFMYHQLPSTVNTTVGNLAMDGHVEVYALQFEIALTERLSLVATKDGYIRIRPDAQTPQLWTNQSGFANLGGGLKYAFIYDPENSFVMSGSATYEFPTGNRDVYQGAGNGALNLILSTVKLWDDFQVAGGAGVRLPFDGRMSTSSFVSAHASYEVTPWFIPLVELNWHHVLSAGNGVDHFDAQAAGLTAQVATFEGSDLLNFGAANAGQNRDLVTAAVGFRSRLTESVDLGFAYEVPLTSDDDSVIDSRITVDMIWSF